MPTTVAQLASALQTVFTSDADQAARECGFIQRLRKLSGATFVQTLVFAWLDNPHATHEDLAEVAAELGVDISADALGRRLDAKACACLQEVLTQALHHVIAAQPAALPLLQRFHGVYVRDGSTFALPHDLADVLPGCGGGCQPGHGRAALKVVPQLELISGSLDAIRLLPGKNAERADELAWAPLPEGALLLEDNGFFNLERLRYYASHKVCFLNRLPTRICVWDEHGQKHTLAGFLRGQKVAEVDTWLEVGSEAKLRVRLLAERVPEAVARKRQQRLRRQASKKGRAVSSDSLELCCWNMLISNVPDHQLSFREAQVLRRLRWQIELLFKVWKSEGRMDESAGHKPYRVLCEVLAKLLAMVVQHWVSLVAAGNPLQYSQRKAARRVRRVALRLVRALGQLRQLQQVVEQLGQRLGKHCRVRSRKGSRHPAAFQTVLNPERDGVHNLDPP